MPPKTKGNEKVGVYVPLGGSKHPIAYCNYHKATLSKAQMDAKECLNRKCYHLQKFENEYWKKRKQLKASGKAKRQFAREEIEEMMETRIVTREQKDKELERGNVFVGETRATKPVIKIDPTDYDEADIKARAEQAVKPIMRETFLAYDFEQRKKWLFAMKKRFPNVGQSHYEKVMGFGWNALQHTFEKAKIERTKGRTIPEQEKEAWNKFWGIEEVKKEEPKEEKKAEVSIATSSSYGKVEFTGTLKGRAIDVLKMVELLGLGNREIEVTI